MIEDIINKEKVAIVVVGYNRLEPIQRLLNALLVAKYPTKDIPLVISIDCSEDRELYQYVNSFVWPHGEKIVRIQEKRLGLKKHIIECGDLTIFFKGIVLFEDDIYPSPYFYMYALQSMNFYYNDDRIAGIALYKPHFNVFVGIPQFFMNNCYDVFLYQFVCSWGQCWTDIMWKNFKSWLSNHNNINWNDINMPTAIGQWERAWTKFYYAYIIDTQRYFIYPQTSLSTNFSEVGDHAKQKNNSCQVELLNGYHEFKFGQFDNLIRYDVFQYNQSIKEYLSEFEDITIDFWNYRPSKFIGRYLLSCRKLNYKIVKQFGMSLKPIELNIINNIEGSGIFLYDTTVKYSNKNSEQIFSYFYTYISKEYFLLGGRYALKEIISGLLYYYSPQHLIKYIMNKIKH